MLQSTMAKLYCYSFSVLLFSVHFLPARADYSFRVRAHNYINPLGIGSNGNCCESTEHPECPTDTCDTSFVFCLRELGTEQNGDENNCPLGRFQTSDGGIGGNSILFDIPFIQEPNVPNPLIFTGNSWPGGVQLFIEVEDIDTTRNDHIDDIYIESILQPGDKTGPQNYTGMHQKATVSLSFEVFCTRLFGPNCSDVCEPLAVIANGAVQQPSSITEGSNATYSCDPGFELNGPPTRLCQNDGWSGNEPVCTQTPFTDSVSSTTFENMDLPPIIGGAISGVVVFMVIVVVLIILFGCVCCKRKAKSDKPHWVNCDPSHHSPKQHQSDIVGETSRQQKNTSNLSEPPSVAIRATSVYSTAMRRSPSPRPINAPTDIHMDSCPAYEDPSYYYI